MPQNEATNDDGNLEATDEEVNDALESGTDATSQTTDDQDENLEESDDQSTSGDDSDEDSDEESEEETEDDDEDVSDFTEHLHIPEIQPPQPGQDGSVNMEEYTRYIMNENLRQMAFAESERKLYRAVEKKYPEFKSNAKLRTLIVNNRLVDVQNGGDGDLMRIAEDVFGLMSDKRNEGKAAQRTSVKVQKTAALATSGPAQVSSGNVGIEERMQSNDPKVAQQARLELLTKWQKEGKI